MLAYFKDDLNLILEKTIDSWKNAKNKTFFITGGTGFFGIWLLMSFISINRTLKLNAKIIILTRHKNKFINQNQWLNQYNEVFFLEGEITSFEFIEDKIDYIIHAATEASVKLNIEMPLTMFETVVNGTKRVLEFAKLKKVKSFLFTSSGAVYGKQPSNLKNVTEDCLFGPDISDSKSVYGEGKRMAEVLCAVYFRNYAVPVKVARCYTFIGPFMPLDSHFAAGNFIGNILKSENIIINGDGTPIRSYMYSADLVIWLWTILFKGANNSPYNVGSDESISITQFADLVLKESNFTHLTKIITTPISNKESLSYLPSIEKAMIDLNLKIYTSIEISINKTINYYLNN